MAEYSLGMRVEYGGVQLVPCPACAHLPPGKKWSGERGQIF